MATSKRRDRSMLLENPIDEGRGIQDIIVVASNSESTGSHLSSVCFTIRRLNLTETSLSRRDLALLAQTVARSGLSVRELNLSWMFTAQASQRYMTSFGTLMAACFAAEPFENTGEVSSTSLTKLNLDFSKLNVFHLASLFSAIHAGNDRQRGVRELSLQGFCGNQSWLWLSLGLFHRASNSQIVELDLSHCVIRLEDIELVRRLLDSMDYTPHLMQKRSARMPCRPPNDPHQDSKHRWILLPAGTRLQAPRDPEEHQRGNPQDVLALQTEQWCEALQRGKRWTCLLVPGYGVLWVKSSKIIKTESFNQHGTMVAVLQQQQRQLCKLETLTMTSVNMVSQVLQVSDEDGHLRGSTGTQPVDHVLSEWVMTVGRSLLTLRLSDNPLTNRAMTTVLESCPLLRNLDVEGCELTTIAPITDAFRRESCRLRTLNAAQNDINTPSQTDLFRVLGDPECNAARNLQVLHLEENPITSSNRMLSFIVNPTLRRNKTLRKLKMTMDTKHENALTIRHSFGMLFQGEWLACEELPCKQCLTLLSIPCTKTLPTVIIKVILEFAKRDIYRQIQWEEW